MAEINKLYKVLHMVLSIGVRMSSYNTLLEDKDMGFKTPLEQANEYIERLNRRIAELYAEVERVNKINVELEKELYIAKSDLDFMILCLNKGS